MFPRFLVCSDIHAHPFPYGSQHVAYPPFKGLHNSRLVSTMRALEGVADYAVRNGASTVLFAGDMYHTRTSVKTVARNMVEHVIKTKFVDQGLTLVMIPGNHDYADRVGHVHSMQTLSYLGDLVHVVDDVRAIELQGMRVICVPYTDSVKKARTDLQVAAELAKQDKDKPSVLLCHLGVQGALVGSDYVMICPSDVGGEEIPFADFDLCFFGHYHQHQMIDKNAWFTGALTEQNWSDVNGNRGFIDVSSDPDGVSLALNQVSHKVSGRQGIARDGSRVACTRIETGAPRFLLAQSPEDLDAAREEDFVIYVTSETLTLDQQTQLRQRCKALQMEIKPLKNEEKLELTFDAAKLNAETALPAWVKAKAGDLEPESLLDLGRELLSVGQGNAIQ